MSEFIKNSHLTKFSADPKFRSLYALCDPNMSWKAKGMYLYLCTQPNHADLTEHSLMPYASNGEVSFRSGIRELKQHGYLTFKRKPYPGKKQGLRVVWYLHNLPQFKDKKKATQH